MQNIATALFIGLGLIVVFLGWYVFSHRNKPVIIFHPEKDRSLSKIMLVLGIVLIICGSLSIISAFTTLMIFKPFLFDACVLNRQLMFIDAFVHKKVSVFTLFFRINKVK